MSRKRIIPFTADVIGGIILEKPKLLYISCPVIALGVKEFRGFDPDYNIVRMRAFAIEYKKTLLASRFFNDELWSSYMAIMCQCCDSVNFTTDIDFLIQNGVPICV
jgi:hypothetical protein